MKNEKAFEVAKNYILNNNDLCQEILERCGCEVFTEKEEFLSHMFEKALDWNCESILHWCNEYQITLDYNSNFYVSCGGFGEDFFTCDNLMDSVLDSVICEEFEEELERYINELLEDIENGELCDYDDELINVVKACTTKFAIIIDGQTIDTTFNNIISAMDYVKFCIEDGHDPKHIVIKES